MLRKLVWIKEACFQGCGCSECARMFSPNVALVVTCMLWMTASSMRETRILRPLLCIFADAKYPRRGRPMPKGMEWLSLNSIAVAS